MASGIPLHRSLDGQVALVTGANRGIGRAVAAGLLGLGATVYAGARDPRKVDLAAARPVRLDVDDPATVKAALATVRKGTDRLDVLVNNAGVIGPEEPLASCDVESLQATITTNLLGPMVVAREALPLLLARDGGRVVNVSSGAGSFGEGMMPQHVAYCVSKAGLNALTFMLHDQHGAHGLIANSVCPGWVRTEMGGPSAPRSVERGAETPLWLCRFKPGAPSGGFFRDKKPIPW